MPYRVANVLRNDFYTQTIKIDDEKFYSFAEIAKLFGVHRQTIHNMRKDKKLPAPKQYGQAFYYSGKQIKNYLLHSLKDDSFYNRK